MLLTPNDVAKFQTLAEKAHQITIDNLKKDEDYEDAPDEFIGKYLSLFFLELMIIFKFYLVLKKVL